MLAALFFACVCGWVANLSISVYAHRCLAHRALQLHPLAAHLFRFSIWLTTGTGVRRWVAVHRRHHAMVDRVGDPHSPVIFGLPRVLFGVYGLYRAACLDTESVRRFGQDCPEDWLERNVYGDDRGSLGLLVLLLLDFLLFPVPAAMLAGLIQLTWMPVCGGIINGLGHAVGYRNFDTRDASRNIVPFGLIIAGEELHNNHHRYPSSARFSMRWGEMDVGWWVIRILGVLGLATSVRVDRQEAGA